MVTRGLTGAVLVLIGGLVVSTIPPSSPLVQLRVLAEVRATEPGRMAGLTVVLVGLAMLASAWLALCRMAARTPADQQDEALGLVRHATLVWCMPFLLAPPLFSRDGWSYAAQGTLTHLGVSPYSHGPGVLDGPIVEGVDPRWLFTPTPYGPLPLILGDVAAGFTGNPWMLVVAHRVFALVGLVLLAWAVPRLARWCGTRPALATAIVIASPMMMANGAGGLHNDLLMVGLMAAALVVAVERGWFWGALLGGAAAAVKFPGGLVCIAVALVTLPLAATLAERVRRLALVAAVSLSALLGTGLVWGLGLGWLEAVGVPGIINTPLSAPTVLGGLVDWVAVQLGAGLAPAAFLDLFRMLATGASLAFAGWVAFRAPTGDRTHAVRACAALVGITLLLSPVVHIWYLMWLVPFLAPLRLSRLAMMAVVAVSVILGLVAPLDSSLHGAYLAILLGTTYVTLAAAVLLVTRRSRARLERIAEAEWVPVH